MTALALSVAAAGRRSPLQQALLAAVGLLTAVIAVALLRAIAAGWPIAPDYPRLWLALHLAAVIPAVPLGGWLLWARKGTAMHRRLGRLWAGLMMATAISSYGLQSSGHLSWIHLLSALVLVSVPRAVWLAATGRIAAHQAAITRVYVGLVVAGFFTFLPNRLLGQWLFG